MIEGFRRFESEFQDLAKTAKIMMKCEHAVFKAAGIEYNWEDGRGLSVSTEIHLMPRSGRERDK